ncbi:hypothetical protein [Parabacteroides sp.]
MKQLLPIILIGLCPHWLQAQSQIWETGTFMCVAEETGSWQAGAGQPFSETNPKSCFLYGCTEIVSSIQEEEEIESILLDMKVLTLEEGESGQLYATIKADDSANQVGETVIPMSGYPSGIYWVRLPDRAISILKE